MRNTPSIILAPDIVAPCWKPRITPSTCCPSLNLIIFPSDVVILADTTSPCLSLVSSTSAPSLLRVPSTIFSFIGRAAFFNCAASFAVGFVISGAAAVKKLGAGASSNPTASVIFTTISLPAGYSCPAMFPTMSLKSPPIATFSCDISTPVKPSTVVTLAPPRPPSQVTALSSLVPIPFMKSFRSTSRTSMISVVVANMLVIRVWSIALITLNASRFILSVIVVIFCSIALILAAVISLTVIGATDITVFKRSLPSRVL